MGLLLISIVYYSNNTIYVCIITIKLHLRFLSEIYIYIYMTQMYFNIKKMNLLTSFKHFGIRKITTFIF